ncbi:MAG TPA: CoB--CoM heterodisulfide reductase iron-sulfur subunit B family protein [Syntrophomonadaceae bacterium]|nr:CoB--CoM heterodisulfide reductase iron-sulfur subunit B family protein [Syntrophomonadaceae bacterium]
MNDLVNKDKALFAGCLVTSRFPEYELSSKRVLETIGVKTHTLPGAVCCGQVLQGVNSNWIYMTAYNLALAEKRDMDLITLCGGCTNTFKRVQHMCCQNPQLLRDINRVLKKVGLHLDNTVKTQHLLEVLHEHSDRISEQLAKTAALKAAVMNPCQVFRPANIMQFDDSEHPQVMKGLLEKAVSEVIPYSFQDYCCGASLSMSNSEAAFQIGRMRLQELEQKNVDLIVTACGNCHLLLDSMQREYYSGRKIPCLFLPQLLGIAMGLSPDDIMINDRSVRSILNNA